LFAVDWRNRVDCLVNCCVVACECSCRPAADHSIQRHRRSRVCRSPRLDTAPSMDKLRQHHQRQQHLDTDHRHLTTLHRGTPRHTTATSMPAHRLLDRPIRQDLPTSRRDSRTRRRVLLIRHLRCRQSTRAIAVVLLAQIMPVSYIRVVHNVLMNSNMVLPRTSRRPLISLRSQNMSRASQPIILGITMDSRSATSHRSIPSIRARSPAVDQTAVARTGSEPNISGLL